MLSHVRPAFIFTEAIRFRPRRQLGLSRSGIRLRFGFIGGADPAAIGLLIETGADQIGTRFDEQAYAQQNGGGMKPKRKPMPDRLKPKSASRSGNVSAGREDEGGTDMGQHPLRVGVLSVPFCPVPYASAGHPDIVTSANLWYSETLIARIVTHNRGQQHTGSEKLARPNHKASG